MKTVTLEYKQTYHENGKIYSEAYYLDGKLHNPNGIAWKAWLNNGQLISESYWLNGKLHNENGIALVEWYRAGNIYQKEYWINGKELTKKEFDNRNKPKPCDNKTVEVDGVKYKLTAI